MIEQLMDAADGDEDTDLLDEIEEVLAERNSSNEEFLRAMCNRPPLE